MLSKIVEFYDENGALVATKTIEIQPEINWNKFNINFFKNQNFNHIRLLIKKENSVSELSAMRMESLALKNTENFEIFVECWNGMVQSIPDSAAPLITKECINTWNSIANDSGMPFIYSDDGTIEMK